MSSSSSITNKRKDDSEDANKGQHKRQCSGEKEGGKDERGKGEDQKEKGGKAGKKEKEVEKTLLQAAKEVRGLIRVWA